MKIFVTPTCVILPVFFINMNRASSKNNIVFFFIKQWTCNHKISHSPVPTMFYTSALTRDTFSTILPTAFFFSWYILCHSIACVTLYSTEKYLACPNLLFIRRRQLEIVSGSAAGKKMQLSTDSSCLRQFVFSLAADNDRCDSPNKKHVSI